MTIEVGLKRHAKNGRRCNICGEHVKPDDMLWYWDFGKQYDWTTGRPDPRHTVNVVAHLRCINRQITGMMADLVKIQRLTRIDPDGHPHTRQKMVEEVQK